MAALESTDPAEAPGQKRLKGAEAVRLHLTLAGGLILCISAFLFEVRRALGGNELSWAYVFEWPLFAVFAFYMWWNLLHQTKEKKRKASSKPKFVAPEHVEMLKAWQAHQETLAVQQRGERHSDSGSEPVS